MSGMHEIYATYGICGVCWIYEIHAIYAMYAMHGMHGICGPYVKDGIHEGFFRVICVFLGRSATWFLWGLSVRGTRRRLGLSGTHPGIETDRGVCLGQGGWGGGHIQNWLSIKQPGLVQKSLQLELADQN